MTQGLGSLTDANLKTALDNNIGAGKYEISGDETNGWTVTVKGKSFKINNTGKMEELTLTTGLTISGETTVASGAKIELTVAQAGGGNEEIEWSVNDNSKATVAKKDESKATVTGVGEGTAVITAKAKNSGKTATYSITVTAPKFSDYTWTEIADFAKEIAKDSTITNQTANATKTVNGKEYTAKVGDEKTITIASKDYIVRILGFNHDTLESGATAYNDSTITKAGISFEFKTLLPAAQMNSTSTNANGWGASLMRTNLNSTSAVDGMVNLSNIESVIGSNIIKSVTKSYIKTYNDANSVTQCNDKLWLLACSEVANSGYKDGAYACAITSEGSQYKYYADSNIVWNSSNTNLVKCNAGSTSGSLWWLRSPGCNYSSNFCYVNSGGNLGNDYRADFSGGVAPGFAI